MADDGRVKPFGDQSVGALLPGGFEAYGRVLPPIWHVQAERTVPQRWRDIAGQRGIEFGPEIRFNDLVGWDIWRDASNPPSPPYFPPSNGTLDEPETAVLALTLARHTTRADLCWFALWEGYGWPETDHAGRRPSASAGATRATTCC